MDRTPPPARTEPEALSGSQRRERVDRPARLGDVLYAGTTSVPAAEKDWARLVARIAAGDQVALHALYARSHRIVFTLAVRISGSHHAAEEMTLDVFLEVWRQAPTYNPREGTVVGWIMNLARSRAVGGRRLEQGATPERQGQGEAPAPAPAATARGLLETRQHTEAFRGALAVLGEEERRAIEAAYFAELTHVEVAEQLRQPLATVNAHMRSGLLKLRAALAGPVP